MGNRRKFLKQGSLVSSGLCIGASGYFYSCTPFVYVEHTIANSKVVVSKSQFGEEPYVILKIDHLKKPVYLTKLDTGDYVALYMHCMHKGCTVRPKGNILSCPCHGSEYSNTGKVLEGPTEKDLQVFKVTHDDENVYIF